MKVIAINGSPKMEEGNTARILNPFLDGMKEAGAEIDLFYTSKLKIKPCQGDFHCWFITPGKCMHNDDMDMLIPKFEEADITIYSTPLYADGVSGPLKNLIDRQISRGNPTLEFRDGECRHPATKDQKRGKLILVSSCGLWEMSHFDPVLMHMKAYCKNMIWDFAGALLRPHAPAMMFLDGLGKKYDDIFEAAKEAGKQMITDGRMSEKTLQIIGRELMPPEDYVNKLNEMVQTFLEPIKNN
jgi:multimeric flavodoxin WrbA